MQKFHSALSRRDFMKGIGLAGIGLGSASVTAPVFHDMDEVILSPNANKQKNPWWMKERPYMDPTTEVDWDVIQRWDGRKYDSFSKQFSPEVIQQVQAEAKQITEDGIRNNKPGFTMKDHAFINSAYNVIQRMSYRIPVDGGPEDNQKYACFMGDQKMLDEISAPEDLGIPKLQGTPEENGRMIRSLLRFHGAFRVRFLEVDDRVKKMVYAGDARHPEQPWVFEDVDKPYVSKTKMVIPNTYKYAIVFSTRGSFDGTLRTGCWIGGGVALNQCLSADYPQLYLQRFMKAIGYGAVGSDDASGFTSYPGIGALAGHGELGRIGHLIGSEQWLRCTRLMLTDLPVGPMDNPIDFGAAKFCVTCRKCREACPVGAPNDENDPTWEAPKMDGNPYFKPELFNNPGKKVWPLNHALCRKYWNQRTDTYTNRSNICGICMSACVFQKLHKGSIHDTVRAMVASTPIFNSFFTNMDKAFGYGPLDENKWEEWWDLQDNMPEHGLGSMA
ncbi:MAG: reductive dehalogenase [Dehalococcoides mccartyi]|jgi:reductive dehalogenase